MFRGAGKLGLRTANSPKVMYSPRANSFKLTLESTQENAKAFPYGTCGTRQIVDEITTEQTYKLTLGIESFDPLDISFVMNEQIGTANNFTFPHIENAIIPSTGALVLADANLITDQVVAITILDSLTTTRLLTQVPSASTPTAGQFKVSSGQITFNTGEAGKPINYMYDRNFATMRGIGFAPNPSDWGEVAFSGIVCGDRFPKPFRIFVPSMKPTPKFDFSIGDKSTIEMEFTLRVAAGYRSPLLIGDL